MYYATLRFRLWCLLLQSAALRLSKAIGLGPLAFSTAVVTATFIAVLACGTVFLSFTAGLIAGLVVALVAIAGLSTTFFGTTDVEQITAAQQRIRELIRNRQEATAISDSAIVEVDPAESHAVAHAVPSQQESSRRSNVVAVLFSALISVANALAMTIGVLVLALLRKQTTKRPQNWCESCGHTWYPRGASVSKACPSCESREVELADVRDAAAIGWLVAVLGIAVVGAAIGLQDRKPSIPNHASLKRGPAGDTDRPAGTELRDGKDELSPRGQVSDPSSDKSTTLEGQDELPLVAPTATLVLKVTRIIDGDTLQAYEDGKRVLIDLADVDCPELDQPFGDQAFRFTSNSTLGQTVRVKPLERRGENVIGLVTLANGKTLSRNLIGAGLAWRLARLDEAGNLWGLQQQAKNKQLGVWSKEAPIQPWHWRDGIRDARNIVKPNQPGATTTHWLNTSSGVRHNRSCKYYRNTQGGRMVSAGAGRACRICGG